MNGKIAGLILLLSLLFSCKTVQLIQDDLTPETLYYQNDLLVGKFQQSKDLEKFINDYYNKILSNESLNADEKEDLIKDITSLKYNKNQYYYIQLESDIKLLNDNHFDFDIKDENDQSILHKIIPVIYTVENVQMDDTQENKEMSQILYYYIWVLSSYAPSDKPVKIFIQYPDKTHRTYKINQM